MTNKELAELLLATAVVGTAAEVEFKPSDVDPPKLYAVTGVSPAGVILASPK